MDWEYILDIGSALLSAPFVAIGVIAFLGAVIVTPVFFIALIIWVIKYAFGSEESFRAILKRINFTNNELLTNLLVVVGVLSALYYLYIVLFTDTGNFLID
tara:strand:+ start:1281 stop:1583 length:303 start_codon:yes stop_codon:yes gene_type:complete